MAASSTSISVEHHGSVHRHYAHLDMNVLVAAGPPKLQDDQPDVIIFLSSSDWTIAPPAIRLFNQGYTLGPGPVMDREDLKKHIAPAMMALLVQNRDRLNILDVAILAKSATTTRDYTEGPPELPPTDGCVVFGPTCDVLLPGSPTIEMHLHAQWSKLAPLEDVTETDEDLQSILLASCMSNVYKAQLQRKFPQVCIPDIALRRYLLRAEDMSSLKLRCGELISLANVHHWPEEIAKSVARFGLFLKSFEQDSEDEDASQVLSQDEDEDMDSGDEHEDKNGNDDDDLES